MFALYYAVLAGCCVCVLVLTMDPRRNGAKLPFTPLRDLVRLKKPTE